MSYSVRKRLVRRGRSYGLGQNVQPDTNLWQQSLSTSRVAQIQASLAAQMQQLTPAARTNTLYANQPASGFIGYPQPATVTALPDFSVATGGALFQNNSVNWGTISDDGVLNLLQHRLVEVYAQSPLATTDPDTGNFSARRPYISWPAGRNYEIREDAPFITALKCYWVRMGRDPSLWTCGSFNFGPNTNSSKDLHIAQGLYERLANPQTPLWVNSGGYTYLNNQDFFWNTVLVQELVQAGYLSAQDDINTNEDGAVIGALKAFFDDGVAADTAMGSQLFVYGTWPSGYNFGPNTGPDACDGYEARLPPELIWAVLNGWSSRGMAQAIGNVQATFKGADIRPPIFGMPSDAGTAPKLAITLPAATQVSAQLAPTVLSALRNVLKS